MFHIAHRLLVPPVPCRGTEVGHRQVRELELWGAAQGSCSAHVSPGRSPHLPQGYSLGNGAPLLSKGCPPWHIPSRRARGPSCGMMYRAHTVPKHTPLFLENSLAEDIKTVSSNSVQGLSNQCVNKAT